MFEVVDQSTVACLYHQRVVLDLGLAVDVFEGFDKTTCWPFDVLDSIKVFVYALVVVEELLFPLVALVEQPPSGAKSVSHYSAEWVLFGRLLQEGVDSFLAAHFHAVTESDFSRQVGEAVQQFAGGGDPLSIIHHSGYDDAVNGSFREVFPNFTLLCFVGRAYGVFGAFVGVLLLRPAVGGAGGAREFDGILGFDIVFAQLGLVQLPLYI